MSIDQLSAFIAHLQEDEALRQSATALGDDEREAGLCRLAKEHGFDVTPEDLRAAHAVPAVAELDDTVLKDLVGGSCQAIGISLIGQTDPGEPMG
jgi:predicted ribosomally synthesized peptide with nif11-like leader